MFPTNPSCSPGVSYKSSSFTSTFPDEGLLLPFKIFSNVDLPAPLLPIIPARVPESILNDSSCNPFFPFAKTYSNLFTLKRNSSLLSVVW